MSQAGDRPVAGCQRRTAHHHITPLVDDRQVHGPPTISRSQHVLTQQSERPSIEVAGEHSPHTPFGIAHRHGHVCHLGGHRLPDRLQQGLQRDRWMEAAEPRPLATLVEHGPVCNRHTFQQPVRAGENHTVKIDQAQPHEIRVSFAKALQRLPPCRRARATGLQRATAGQQIQGQRTLGQIPVEFPGIGLGSLTDPEPGPAGEVFGNDAVDADQHHQQQAQSHCQRHQWQRAVPFQTREASRHPARLTPPSGGRRPPLRCASEGPPARPAPSP